MQNSNRAYLLGPLLKGVSRSFYLTLRVLPVGMRDPVGEAYLLARAADTIADTSLIPPAQRLALLLAFRERVNGNAGGVAGDQSGDALKRIASEVAGQQTQSDEKLLLESLDGALDVLDQLDEDDRAAAREIVTTLTEGMEFDLRTFPDERSGQVAALGTWDELDRYTYLVAGCVGEFWTKMTYMHMPGALDPALRDTMYRRGVRFGKALQMVNVLRDCGKDLRIGRCYLPATMLAQAALSPADLMQPGTSARARPLMFSLVRIALDHFRAAIDYTFALPRLSLRLRLACLWPILIGLETLERLVDNEDWLDPARPSKLTRNDVYRILACSTLAAPSNALLDAWFKRLLKRIESRMKAIEAH
ncbi:squalene/phytoene synthase family protein [Paraburkholderia sp. Ac-20347]|uniref:squalene/phytoene synthase family protein n=1 Tax=Paraburkholderia sp. Ac-20347 TaxID=2703892 RepID=UPI001981A9ED|nr:squalene/phytoene synthase family protein [Paraburkholderia sp. Ac-20347]MBN3807949.1 squalene/phytoene synthase family protein [Paraburkholderia sp. Ac-20347]